MREYVRHLIQFCLQHYKLDFERRVLNHDWNEFLSFDTSSGGTFNELFGIVHVLISKYLKSHSEDRWLQCNIVICSKQLHKAGLDAGWERFATGVQLSLRIFVGKG